MPETVVQILVGIKNAATTLAMQHPQITFPAIGLLLLLWFIRRRLRIYLRGNEAQIKELVSRVIDSVTEGLTDDSLDIRSVKDKIAAQKKNLRRSTVALRALLILMVLLVAMQYRNPHQASHSGQIKAAPAPKNLIVRLFVPSSLRSARIEIDGQPPLSLKRTTDIIYVAVMNKASQTKIDVIDRNGNLKCTASVNITQKSLDIWPCD